MLDMYETARITSYVMVRARLWQRRSPVWFASVVKKTMHKVNSKCKLIFWSH